MFFSKKTLFNTTKVVILVFLIFNFVTTPIEAARPRPRSLHDLKPTLVANKARFLQNQESLARPRPRPLHDLKPTFVANKARFLQNQESLPISSPNPCTHIPTPSNGHCH